MTLGHRSRSKVVARDTPSHASDYMCLIWKESIQNCTAVEWIQDVPYLNYNVFIYFLS